jgi:hypothetical protein
MMSYTFARKDTNFFCVQSFSGIERRHDFDNDHEKQGHMEHFNITMIS